jgi:hypothetical protein
MPTPRTLFSQAIFASLMCLDIPRSPNPAGLKMYEERVMVLEVVAWASGALVAAASSRPEAATHWTESFSKHATLECRGAFTNRENDNWSGTAMNGIVSISPTVPPTSVIQIAAV